MLAGAEPEEPDDLSNTYYRSEEGRRPPNPPSMLTQEDTNFVPGYDEFVESEDNNGERNEPKDDRRYDSEGDDLYAVYPPPDKNKKNTSTFDLDGNNDRNKDDDSLLSSDEDLVDDNNQQIGQDINNNIINFTNNLTQEASWCTVVFDYDAIFPCFSHLYKFL